MAHESMTSNISLIGIKKETTQGTEATGTYRQALVENFSATTETDRSAYNLIAGHKGNTGKNVSGSSQNVEFTLLVGKAGTDVITLLDVMYMIFDSDTVTGTNPYTHTMSLENATVVKPSFSLYHDDGRSNYAVYSGFVLNTATLTVNKEEGTVKVAVSGMAWKESDTTSKTLTTVATCDYYSSNTAVFSIGGTQVDNFKTFSLEFNCGTRVFQSISDSAYPSNIDGTMLELKCSMEGEWNEAVGSVSDDLRTAFLNGTTQTDDFVLSIGANSTSDYFTLTLPRWEIEEETHKAIEGGAMLPQTMTVYPTSACDVSTNGFYIELNNAVAVNAASL